MNNLNTWLQEHHMTQAELAAKLGVTRETINRAANGDEPSGIFLWKFAVTFGFDAAMSIIAQEPQA
jgi:transcriptional regulator with XRE-family HTH domain